MLIKEVIKSVNESLYISSSSLLVSPKKYFSLKEVLNTDDPQYKVLVVKSTADAEYLGVSVRIDYNNDKSVKKVIIEWKSDTGEDISDLISVLSDANKFRLMVLNYIKEN